MSMANYWKEKKLLYFTTQNVYGIYHRNDQLEALLF